MTKNIKHHPQCQGLYDPRNEKDSCGVGFVAHMKGEKSHQMVQDGIHMLERLTHRGACGCDPLTGDGAGLLMQIPHEFFKKEVKKSNFDIPAEGEYGVGLVFLPKDAKEQKACQTFLEEAIKEEGQTLIGWRDVPVGSKSIGYIALREEPTMKHVFIGKGAGTQDQDALERKLLVIRKVTENKVRESSIKDKKAFYITKLSTRTLIYKGQLMSEQLRTYFPDLNDKSLTSALALVHSRYSTNTFPSWDLGQPFRYLAHNGEINTLRGNINWMKARETMFKSDLFGNDMKKLLPSIVEGGSDSAVFDNALEMLVAGGRSLPHSILTMIPEAWSGHESMDEEKKAFYEYYSTLMEPWDGPASMAFTDGNVIGAILDRNGLRPSRYIVTKDHRVVMASEVGVIPVDPANVESKGRLQPGRMFLVDIAKGRIIPDDEIKDGLKKRQPYKKWLADNMVRLENLPEPKTFHQPDHETLITRQKAFGYSLEDLKILMAPMATTGMEGVGSMGEDTPLSVLSQRPRLLYNYFKQLFAQVTNPAIDSIREEPVMSSESTLGPEGNLFDETAEQCHHLKLPHVIVNNKDLEKIRHVSEGKLKTKTLSIVFNAKDGEKGMAAAIKALCDDSSQAIKSGYTILVLSDRAVDKDKAPIPALLATAAIHHHLIREGTRTKVGIAVETGEAREMHHFALLLGYGAGAINPYVALETLSDMLDSGTLPKDLTYEQAEKNYIKSTRKGLLKIIAKMGISTLQSYRGAQIFEAVGLNQSVVDQYFTRTPSRIAGIGLDVITKEVLTRHERAFPTVQGGDHELDVGGFYQWRKGGEYHMVNPESVGKLQYAVRHNNRQAFKEFQNMIDDQSKALATLRGLLKFKFKDKPIPLDEVEPVSKIVKRFCTGAMSFGSISREAHENLAIAMNRLGGRSNTGEGGEDEGRFTPDANGDLRRSSIKQIASGRFGVNSNYLTNADELQIKVAQGAKPGEGGQIAGIKVNEEIASVRNSTPGVGLISPPPHHDIYSIEDLAQLIFDLKNSNPDAAVSVKLVSEVGVGTIAAGVSKGKADLVVIAGFEGGTGASPLTSIKHAGLPWELGLAETQQTLVLNDLRGRIRVQTDGQMKTARDIAIAFLLGADEVGFSTAPLIASGCIMMRVCHLNTCPVGVATQDPELRKRFVGKPEHVVNFFTFLAEEIREIMAKLGYKTVDEMIGRTESLEMAPALDHWKAKGVDVSALLHKPDVGDDIAIHCVTTQDHGIQDQIDYKIIEKAKDAIENKKPVRLDLEIQNIDRAVGAILSNAISKKYGSKGLPDDTIHLKFNGSAGQSFGAWLAPGVSLELEGDANDYVGKGISSGRISIYPPKESTFVAEKNIIIGNVAFYGATGGEAYIRGMAGERFCVRNSGVRAVIEEIGDHGCEYMTGGRAVVLGPTGRNFAAGMSGGIAYVLDQVGDFRVRCNTGMVELFPVEEKEDVDELKTLISNHQKYTGSTVAKNILDNWDKILPKFVKVFPNDYRRVLEERKGGKAKAKEKVGALFSG